MHRELCAATASSRRRTYASYREGVRRGVYANLGKLKHAIAGSFARWQREAGCLPRGHARDSNGTKQHGHSRDDGSRLGHTLSSYDMHLAEERSDGQSGDSANDTVDNLCI